jgi:hypothetical protein
VDGLGRIILGECLDLALVALGTLLGQKSLKRKCSFLLAINNRITVADFAA